MSKLEKSIILASLFFSSIFIYGLAGKKFSHSKRLTTNKVSAAKKGNERTSFVQRGKIYSDGSYDLRQRNSYRRPSSLLAQSSPLAEIKRQVPKSKQVGLQRPDHRKKLANQRAFSSQRILRRTVVSGPASHDSNYNERTKIDDLEYEDRKEDDFLRLAMGLSEQEVGLLKKERSNYVAQLGELEQIKRRGIRVSEDYQKTLTANHIKWMIDHLGADNYYQYLELTQVD